MFLPKIILEWDTIFLNYYCPRNLFYQYPSKLLVPQLLLGSSISNSILIILPIIVILQNLLFALEIPVSIIQSHVFSIFRLLCFNESN